MAEDPQLIEALVKNAEDAYARLFALVEHAVQLDLAAGDEPGTDLQPQIQEAMEQADACLAALTSRIEPWAERRLEMPEATRGRVDRFLELLAKGLESLKKQTDHLASDLETRRDELREALNQLNRQRQGAQGYRPSSDKKSRLFKKEI